MAFSRKRLHVETARHAIEGVLQLPTEGYRSRTTDYLNAHDSDFVALTDVTVRPLDGGEAVEHEFAAVNLRHAVLVIELESLGLPDETAMPRIAALPPVEAPAEGADDSAPSSTPPPGAA